MYILLNNKAVLEIIPEIDPNLPGVPISDRYPTDFIAQLLQVSDDTEVQQNWVYDPETQTFSEPITPDQEESTETTDSETATPTAVEQLRADVDYITVMTGVAL